MWFVVEILMVSSFWTQTLDANLPAPKGFPAPRISAPFLSQATIYEVTGDVHFATMRRRPCDLAPSN
jgi:hypothetical protein